MRRYAVTTNAPHYMHLAGTDDVIPCLGDNVTPEVVMELCCNDGVFLLREISLADALSVCVCSDDFIS